MYITTTSIVFSDVYRHDSVPQNLEPFDILQFSMLCMQSPSVLFLKQTKPAGSDLIGSTYKHGPAANVTKKVIVYVCMCTFVSACNPFDPLLSKTTKIQFEFADSISSSLRITNPQLGETPYR